MISQTLEYALRAVVHLARHPGEPQTTRQIAEATCVPQGYLSKVLQNLIRDGFVGSQRGLGGGFTLVREPGDITIFDMVDAVDPLPRIRRCPLGIPSHGAGLCTLHRRLDQAMEMVEQTFRATTVADILNDPQSPHPLCNPPQLEEEGEAGLM